MSALSNYRDVHVCEISHLRCDADLILQQLEHVTTRHCLIPPALNAFSHMVLCMVSIYALVESAQRNSSNTRFLVPVVCYAQVRRAVRVLIDSGRERFDS